MPDPQELHFLNLILAVGIPSIILMFIYIGRKLQILDLIEKDVRSIKERFGKVEERVDVLWEERGSNHHRALPHNIRHVNGSTRY